MAVAGASALAWSCARATDEDDLGNAPGGAGEAGVAGIAQSGGSPGQGGTASDGGGPTSGGAPGSGGTAAGAGEGGMTTSSTSTTTTGVGGAMTMCMPPAGSCVDLTSAVACFATCMQVGCCVADACVCQLGPC